MNPFTEKPSDLSDHQRLFLGCPFLGLKSDPQSYFSTPDDGNYCYKVKPRRSMDFDHQAKYCLSENYSHCLIYSEAHNEEPQQLVVNIEPETSSPISNDTEVETLILPVIIEQPNIDQKSVEAIASEDQDQTKPSPVTNHPDLKDEPSKIPQTKVTWDQLHKDAKNQYLKEKPNWNGRYIRIGLLAVISIFLVLVALWIFNEFRSSRAEGELSSLSTETLSVATVDNQEELPATAAATEESTPIAENTEPTAQPTTVEIEETVELVPTSSDSVVSQPEATRVDDCSDKSGYPLEILSGPELSPKAGYTYRIGSPEPFFQATWLLKNSGTCTWREIVLQNKGGTGEPTIPFIKRDDVLVDLEDTDQAINPGEEIEIFLRFRAKEATSINQEWVFQINGYLLDEQAHLRLVVDDWVTIVK